LVAVTIGLVGVAFRVTPPVPVAWYEVVGVEVTFSKRMCGELSAVGAADVVFTVLDGKREIVWLNELVVVGAAVVDVEVGAGVVLLTGAGAEVEVEVGAGLEEPLDPEPALELPASKTTMLAVSPSGMVTTQKDAPPAPTD